MSPKFLVRPEIVSAVTSVKPSELYPGAVALAGLDRRRDEAYSVDTVVHIGKSGTQRIGLTISLTGRIELGESRLEIRKTFQVTLRVTRRYAADGGGDIVGAVAGTGDAPGLFAER